jgi:hypothetical protein
MSYTLIGHQRLEATASSITFNEIPQTFTDLYVVASLRSTIGTNTTYAAFRLNGTTSGYSGKVTIGTGDGGLYTGPLDTNQGTLGEIAGSTTANTFGSTSLYLNNYTSSNIKSYSTDSTGEGNLARVYTGFVNGLWSNTAAVNSFTIIEGQGQNFVAGSTATLYGINRTQAIGKPKAIGGNITFANGHWVHTFTGSGTFSAQEDLRVDGLVIAGGAGGAYFAGAGGGAGGVIALGGASLPRGSYPVSVGAGGLGGVSTNAFGFNGSDSTLGSFVAIGGGRAGVAGGSGGGGYYNQGQGAGTAGQGFAGGAWNNAPVRGGGGGASEPGNTDRQGDGGDGILWDNAFYAGGGGGGGDDFATYGGTGGVGGGGNGKYIANQVGDPALINTGSGGGGGAFYANGGNGGSGIVIIRYPAE